ncbi:4-hydroxybenzoate transporter PcaK [Raoultella terrigena]|uniref:4-hydroxybenzoate transporter PcaK n=1 Tax=Raoultella terrigena TaxID=577 RepID=A0A4U9D2C5_RAOTE|nr:4-hydroxybenzoate transporter PcaK [Raoultella terrigena]
MNKTTIDIQAFINEHPFTKYQWMILALCFITVAMDGFDTAIIGFIASDLVQEWGVEKSALGPVMSAALVGLAVGALTAGPLADRIGRKKVLLMSIVVFGSFSLLTAFATSLNQLTLLRFLTGLGLGAAMPNAATLMSEYAPERRRALMVNLMFVGFPMGSSLGGFLSAWMIPHYGWQSVLVLGGVMPLLLAVALIFLLPESARYMVVKRQPAQRIAAILRRIAPLPEGVEFELREAGQVKEKSALAVIFSPRYLVGTVMLCLTYFMGLLIFYLLTSWLPLLIRETGATMSQASIITALFPLGGGIGVLILGALMDKINPNKVVAVGWLLTGIFVCPRGLLHRQPGADGGDGIYRRQHYERRAVFYAGAGGRVLSHSGPRHRRRMDAGDRALWRHSRRLQRRIPDAGAALFHDYFQPAGDPGVFYPPSPCWLNTK